MANEGVGSWDVPGVLGTICRVSGQLCLWIKIYALFIKVATFISQLQAVGFFFFCGLLIYWIDRGTDLWGRLLSFTSAQVLSLLGLRLT